MDNDELKLWQSRVNRDICVSTNCHDAGEVHSGIVHSVDNEYLTIQTREGLKRFAFSEITNVGNWRGTIVVNVEYPE